MQIIEDFKKRGINLMPNSLKIQIPNAKKYLQDGLAYFVGKDYEWLSEYDAIVDWMTDNKGKG